MKRWTPLDGWIDERQKHVAATLEAWSQASSDPDAGPEDVVNDYLNELLVDNLQVLTLDNGARAVYGERVRVEGAPTVLVAGVHDSPLLFASTRSAIDPGVVSDSEGILGPGVASRFGPFVALVEGYFAITAEREGDPPLNVRFLTVDSTIVDEGMFPTVVGRLPLGDVAVVIAAPAIAWDLTAPTMTVGARGHLTVDVTVTTGRDVDASVFGGAARNPLTLLVESLGQLREPNGRINLPGFYHRAIPASEEERRVLTRDGYDASAWMRGSGATGLFGGPNPLERASFWPSVDIVTMHSGEGVRAGDETIPGSASATLMFHLVPDQRPNEIEASLRSWIEQLLPEDVGLDIAVISQSTPYVAPRESHALEIQARVLKRVIGGKPIAVIAGGLHGIAGLGVTLNRPLLFAGLASPSSHIHTAHERMAFQRLRLGTNLAGELYVQLGGSKDPELRSPGSVN